MHEMLHCIAYSFSIFRFLFALAAACRLAENKQATEQMHKYESEYCASLAQLLNYVALACFFAYIICMFAWVLGAIATMLLLCIMHNICFKGGAFKYRTSPGLFNNILAIYFLDFAINK